MSQKPFVLLTGATGLLGGCLLRDMLAAGWQVAVLARASRKHGAIERIEHVLRNWEALGGLRLPRPRVLEGEIDGAAERIRLSPTDLYWAQGHVGQLIHCAASVTFHSHSEGGDPYRTNVGGMRAVLGFCESADIGALHHVSTAYVCGDRAGTILEDDLDHGQTHGNDYERSKFEAEQILHAAAPKLDMVTVFRPSIIVGEMATGYTNSFHGFYTPLKILSAGVSLGGVRGMPPEQFWSALGFRGSDSKNLVPVDWVTAAMTRIIRDPFLHGRHYHLTSSHPTPVQLLGEVFASILSDLASAHPVRTGGETNSETIHDFAEQMSVYRAYWRNDPDFGRDNLALAVPDLPAPRLSRTTLMRLSKWALARNFSAPA